MFESPAQPELDLIDADHSKDGPEQGRNARYSAPDWLTVDISF